MRNRKEMSGYWRPPDGEYVGGIATFKPGDGVDLQLFTPFGDTPFDSETERYNRIFGKTIDGDIVTLTDAFRTGSSVGGPLSTESYHSQRLIVGGHLTEEDTSFDKFRVRYPLLYQWVGLTGITQDFVEKEDNKPGFAETNISYSPPSTKTVETDSQILKIISTGNVSHSQSGNISITEDSYLEIQPEGQIGLHEIINQVSNWRDFFGLATDENIGVSEVIGYKETEATPNQEFKIHYPISDDYEYPDKIHPVSSNFLLRDIDNELSTVFRNWLKTSEKYQNVYDLYFAVVYQSQMYLENQYMMLISAVNLYYQRKCDSKYMSEGEFENVAGNLSQSLPPWVDEEFKGHFLDHALPSANQHSLEKRLVKLVEDNEKILASLEWDFEKEIVDVIEVHDYTVGRSAELQEVSPHWLHEKTMMLTALLETILLREIGIPGDHIREKLKRKYTSNEIISGE